MDSDLPAKSDLGTANPKPIAISGTAEQALYESEALTRAILDAVVDGIITIGEHGIVKSLNPAAERIFGYTAEEVIGRNVKMLMPEPYHSEHDGYLSNYLKTGQKKIIGIGREVTGKRKDGSTFPMELAVSEVQLNDRRLFTGIIRDITERKRAEKATQESEELFRLAIEAAPNAMIMIDQHGKIMLASSQAERMFGYSKEELVGQPIELLVPQRFRKRHPEYRSKFVDTPQARPMGVGRDLYAIRKDGSEFPVEIGLNPIRTKDGVFILSAVVDITTRKNAEEALKEAAEKADAANRAKSEFLANMSHEIRTPMNAVVGLANILATSNAGPERQKEYLNTLQLSAQALMSLINDLLDIAKIESEHIQLDNAPFSLKDLSEEVISILTVKAKEKGITLALSYDPELGGEFIGDPHRIRQVLMNLVSNAVKFTETGSVIVKVSSCINKTTHKQEAYIEVIDTGIGISLEKQQTIFNKFSQADSSITRKYGGTGLGLAISKMLVELMGGTIGLQSTVGQGSTFTVWLPLAKPTEIKALKRVEAEQPQSAKVNKIPQEHKGCILLVEDYQPNILVATAILEQLGFSYEVAQNGQEALDKLAQNNFDLVLMDIQMPVLDGYRTTRMIRQREEEKNLPHIPVIGITAHALSGDKDRCLKAGMDEYIAKPFQPVDLATKISPLISKVDKAHQPSTL